MALFFIRDCSWKFKILPQFSIAIMLTSSDIISLLKTAWGSYSPIVGPPTDDNTVRLLEAILTILYSIYLGANAGCPSGLVLYETAYKSSLATNVGFDKMSGVFKSYDPDISDDATDVLCTKRERRWTATLATQQIIQACERGCCSFILNVVKDTSVHRLRDPNCFYTRVTQQYLLNFLSTHSGGLERVDVVAMFSTMHL